MALTDKLSSIADAIRDKTGKTELLTLDQMPTEIAGIETGGGGSDLPEEVFNITGNCDYRFAYNGWNWFINQYGNKITTNYIKEAQYMFSNSTYLTDIPFEINLAHDFAPSGAYMFYYCSKLKKAPKINGQIINAGSMFYNCYELIESPDIEFKQQNSSSYNGTSNIFSGCYQLEILPYLINLKPDSFNSFFANCYRLKTIPEDYMDDWNFDRIYTYNYCNCSFMFSNCRALRNVSPKILSKIHNEKATSPSYKPYYCMFTGCLSLDEIVGLAVDGGTLTSNVFSSTFQNCNRLKNLIFETNEDGSPKTANWKSQTIDLSASIGYTNSTSENLLKQYGGFTTTTKITGEAGNSYEELKDNPDVWTGNQSYSRYNHDSAVNTINSLPDCSAYGTNTIKFTGNAGELTDGGAINTLTEEEIAVATAKGWTVTFA